MDKRFTSYNIEFENVICIGADWEKYEFILIFKGKTFFYTQKGDISCSADTDHIRCVILEFKQNLMKQFFEENYS